MNITTGIIIWIILGIVTASSFAIVDHKNGKRYTMSSAFSSIGLIVSGGVGFTVVVGAIIAEIVMFLMIPEYKSILSKGKDK